MTTTIYEYRIYCITESTWVYCWGTTPPTTCPNNTAHTVNPNSVNIVSSISQNAVTIDAEDTPITTGGNFRATTVYLTAAPNTVTTQNISYPHPVSLLNAQLHTQATNIGDSIDIAIAPNTTVGSITSNISIGTTVIPVTSTVTGAVMIGYYINITDGTNDNNLGRVISIDNVNSNITVETGTTSAFSTGAYIQMTIYYIKDFYINTNGLIEVGTGKISTAYFPANTTGQILYTNNGSSSKSMSIMLQYFY